MSFALPATDLTSAVANSTGTVDWTKIAQTVGFPDPTSRPHLQFYNESPCELQLNFSTGEQVMLPAGGWQTIGLNPQCTHLAYTVLAVLNASPIIAQLFGTWYAPGETVPPAPILGNSPIGGIVTGGNAQFLQGINQTLSLTEVDVSGSPELAPGSGANTDLVLGARDTLGNPIPLVTLDANAPAVTMANDVQILTSLSSTTPNNQGLFHGKVAGDTTDRVTLGVMGTAGSNSGYIGISQGGVTAPHRISTDGTNILFDGATGLSLPGALAKIGNQASVGSFGAPVIVAQVIAQHIVASSFQVVLDYLTAVGVVGVYRVNAYLWMGNGSNANVQVQVTWNDPSSGLPGAHQFSDGTKLFNGSTLITTNVGYALQSVTIYAQQASHIQVGINDPTGTPNDFITATIERLA